MNSSTERREVRYQGRVQGVGFRYTTRGVGQQFVVSGYVKNLPDGCVELVAEGTPSELDAFLAAVAEAMRGNIHSAQEERFPASGGFNDFHVRY